MRDYEDIRDDPPRRRIDFVFTLRDSEDGSLIGEGTGTMKWVEEIGFGDIAPRSRLGEPGEIPTGDFMWDSCEYTITSLR
jgi:hypothetical protein